MHWRTAKLLHNCYSHRARRIKSEYRENKADTRRCDGSGVPDSRPKCPITRRSLVPGKSLVILVSVQTSFLRPGGRVREQVLNSSLARLPLPLAKARCDNNRVRANNNFSPQFPPSSGACTTALKKWYKNRRKRVDTKNPTARRRAFHTASPRYAKSVESIAPTCSRGFIVHYYFSRRAIMRFESTRIFSRYLR